MSETLEIKLNNKLSELDRLNQTLTELWQRHGLAPSVMHDLNLALEEIFQHHLLCLHGQPRTRDYSASERATGRD